MKELFNIQQVLKAPKSQRNTFGNYNYRSCEDILTAVKKYLNKEHCTLTISDEMVFAGERYYIKATATLTNEAGEQVSVSAYAREAKEKKGMDDSQITGTASSYARKYALNGLFAIDDTKDADSLNTSKEYTQASWRAEVERCMTLDELEVVWRSHRALQSDEDFVAAVSRMRSIIETYKK